MVRKTAVCLIVIGMILSLFAVSAGAVFTYAHNPLDNPRAMEDIVLNPDAVYGFSPNPASKRLGVYADALDWTDPVQVAAAREQRIAYHAQNAQLYKIIEDGYHNGESLETIARKVSQRRNELRLEAYAGDPEGLALVKQSNLETYGNEFGPTADSLYEKYGSWQTVIEKACSSNAGMDACLGLYDEYYYTYGIEEPTAAPPEEPVEPQEPISSQAAVAEKSEQTTVPAAGTGSKQAEQARQSTPATGDSTMLFVLPAAALIIAVVAAGYRKKDKEM